jgi:hypothetical protein
MRACLLPLLSAFVRVFKASLRALTRTIVQEGKRWGQQEGKKLRYLRLTFSRTILLHSRGNTAANSAEIFCLSPVSSSSPTERWCVHLYFLLLTVISPLTRLSKPNRRWPRKPDRTGLFLNGSASVLRTLLGTSLSKLFLIPKDTTSRGDTGEGLSSVFKAIFLFCYYACEGENKVLVL